jgi:hypothetical protein
MKTRCWAAGRTHMDPLLILVIMFIVFWGGGLAIVGPGYPLLHLLLVLAVVVIVIRLLRGEKI